MPVTLTFPPIGLRLTYPYSVGQMADAADSIDEEDLIEINRASSSMGYDDCISTYYLTIEIAVEAVKDQVKYSFTHGSLTPTSLMKTSPTTTQVGSLSPTSFP